MPVRKLSADTVADPADVTGAGRLRAGLLLVFLVATSAGALGVGVRASAEGYAAVDEPQYLLSALSLFEDGDLDIADELAERRWLAFHAEGALPVQTELRPDGRQLSPHDPLLPLLLAVPMGLGGVVAAKLALAVLAGCTAAGTLWIAVRRLALPPTVAVPGVALLFGCSPLAVYGQQVYPELPSALAVLGAVAALTGPLDRRGSVLLVGAVVALPWLSVKYAPVAASLALLGLIRLGRRRGPIAATAAALGLAAAGAVYLLLHELIYGGWTVYSAGDHFQGSGEFGVVGFDPDYPGRSIRLLGLLVDRDFGLAAWQPAWLLLVPAAAALAAVRPRHGLTLAVPLAAGWFTATFVALTMHGFWWPGRQLVVVLPLAGLVGLWWVARLPAAVRWLAAAAAAWGVAIYGVVLQAGWTGRADWVGAPDDLSLHVPLAWVFPDDRVLAGTDVALYGLWLALAAVAAVAAWLNARESSPARTSGPRPAPGAGTSRTSR